MFNNIEGGDNIIEQEERGGGGRGEYYTSDNFKMTDVMYIFVLLFHF
jgi:hypothetical protein